MAGTVELELIPAFVAVVRGLSFTKAAAELGVPKSTISRRVARLEKQLGVSLITRTTRALRLTDAGEAYYARIVPALEAVDEAGRVVMEQKGAPRGTLRLTAPIDFGTLFLAEMLGRFVELYPDVRVELDLSSRRVDLVGEGFHAAFRAGVLEDSSLVARKLARVRFELWASRGYVGEHGAPSTPAELGNHSCVLFREREARSEWSLAGPGAERASVTVRGSLSAMDLGFVRAAVLAGAGIGLLPEWSFPTLEERERVVPILEGWRAEREDGIYLVYPSARPLPQTLVVLRDYVTEWFAKMPERCARALAPVPAPASRRRKNR